VLKKNILLIISFLPPSWRDYIFGINRFRAKKRICPQTPAVIFFTEKGKWHGGFADRMKGIVSLYHFCLCKEIPFKINYAYPFCLSDFLQPNKYDWQINEKMISFHRKEAKLMFLYGKNKVKRLFCLNTSKQIHAFFNTDIVEQLNAEFHTDYTWGQLFGQLFKPAEILQSEINRHLKIINGNYICAVFRFQNLFGDFQEYKCQPLNETEQNILIQKCLKSLLELQEEENSRKILVTSDSAKFLTAVAELENIFAFPAKVVHIDCTENEQYNVYMKSFLDFYLISNAEKVFCVGTKEMYPSEFPMYAAKINDIPFERILTE
jgi:hypothetical protein